MTLSQWLLFILFCQLYMFLKLWKLYKKAGYSSWKAVVPIYNSVILLKIIKRPTWWVILLYCPIINLLMLPVVWVETSRSFGKDKTKDTFLSWVSIGFYGFYLNYFANTIYIYDRELEPKGKFWQFIESIIYAVVIATLVHTYFMQQYIIQTG